MKKNFPGALLLLLSLLLTLSACGMQRFRDDLEVEHLMDDALQALNDGVAYASADDDHFDGYFELPEEVDEIEVRYSVDANRINEVGILHVEDGTPRVAAELIESYLSRSYEENRSFYDSYIPSETAKLRDAEVRVFGNYVVYAVLDTPAREVLFGTVKARLEK